MVRLYLAAIEEDAETDVEDDDALIVGMALWESVNITYRRCFTGGRSLAGSGIARLTLFELLDHLSSDLRAIHEDLLANANQHYAHRVNALLSGHVTVILRQPPSRGIEGLATTLIQFTTPNLEQLLSVAKLANILCRSVHNLMEHEETVVLNVLATRLDWCYAEVDAARSVH